MATISLDRTEPLWKTGDGRMLKPSEMTDIHVLYAFRWYQRHCDGMFGDMKSFHRWGRVFLAELNIRGLKPLSVEEILTVEEYYKDGLCSVEKVLAIYKVNPKRVIKAAKKDAEIYKALLEITRGKEV